MDGTKIGGIYIIVYGKVGTNLVLYLCLEMDGANFGGIYIIVYGKVDAYLVLYLCLEMDGTNIGGIYIVVNGKVGASSFSPVLQKLYYTKMLRKGWHQHWRHLHCSQWESWCHSFSSIF